MQSFYEAAGGRRRAPSPRRGVARGPGFQLGSVGTGTRFLAAAVSVPQVNDFASKLMDGSPCTQ